MNIYAIGDLHLSLKKAVNPEDWDGLEEYKPMGIFGAVWEDHCYKIYINWNNIVQGDDIVLVPGDISWASTMEELEPDLDFIKRLPGRKLFVRGNHDYWWQRISKLRSVFPEDCILIQNDSFSFRNTAIGGSRGWIVPNDFQFTEQDRKIYNRELIRLEMSLKDMDSAADLRIVMLHYMPVDEKHNYNEVIELLKAYDIDICVYGHLHGTAHEISLNGEKWGIIFHLVSADFLGFVPKKIIEL